jgi:site-specific DNA recombinase
MRSIVAYIRVSTEEQAQHGFSLETQREFLADYARGHQLQIVRTFEESHSAYRPGRPQYEAMLAFLRKRKDVSGVLVYKVDRLARNLSDYSTLEEMDGVDIISATEALPTGSSGRYIGTIHAATSRFYSDQLGERVRHAAATKIIKGGLPGPAPTGYVNRTDTKTIEPDPVMAPIIRTVFETYAREDVALSALTKRARALGLQTKQGGVLGKGSLHHLLQNPIYYGKIRWGGKEYPGAHEPIISEALFGAVQARLRGGSSPQAKRQFPYRGLLKCGYCGCTITASRIKDMYNYYHCTRGKGPCAQAFLREDALSVLFHPIVEGVAMSQTQVAELLQEIEVESKRRLRDAESRASELERQSKSLEALRDKAYEDKLRGTISEERWLEMDGRWSEKANALDAQMCLLESEEGPALDEAEIAFKLLQRIPALYFRQSHEERARFLKVLLSNSSLVGGKILPIYRKPFDLVAEGLQRSTWLPG